MRQVLLHLNGVNFNRKFGRRPRDRSPLSIRLVAFGNLSGDCAQVIRLEVLSLWAVAGVAGSPFQASGTCLRVLRQGLLIEQARSQSLPSFTLVNGFVL